MSISLLYYMQLNFQSRSTSKVMFALMFSSKYEAEQIVINIVTQLCCIQYSIL